MKEYKELERMSRKLEGRIKKGEASIELLNTKQKDGLDMLKRDKMSIDKAVLWIQDTILVHEEVIDRFAKISTKLEKLDYEVSIPLMEEIKSLKKVIDDTK